MRWVMATTVAVSVSMAGIHAEESPRVILMGSGPTESAPHGHGNVYAPSVLIDGGQWKMWYGGQGKDGHDRIHYAESVDGQTWTKKGVVLEDSTANHINDPCVLKIEDRFFMYYTRAESFVIDRIYVATSHDGMKWEPLQMALDGGPEGAWDALSVGRPTVIRDEGLFKMWYDGRKNFPPGTPVKGVPVAADSHRFVGYATSRDGLTWQRHGHDPVFDHDAGAVDVIRLASGYVMTYESHGGTRYARSLDGMTWEDAGWVAEKSAGQIDRYGHVTPCLLKTKDTLWLFFGAAQAATWDHNCLAVLSVKADLR